MDSMFDPSLALYLPLHDRDGASFMSKDAYGHVCTVTGAAWQPKGGRFDNSDDYMEIPHHSTLKPTSAMTIIMWVKQSTVAEYDILLDCYTSTPEGYRLLVTNEGKIRFGAQFDVGGWKTWDSDTATSTEWEQIAVTWSNPNLAMYKNAESFGYGSRTAPITHGTGVLRVGKATSGSSYPFGGLIGEVWVFSRGLSPAEIQRNYLATRRRYQ